MDVARLEKESGISIRSKTKWPNTIVFPKELRDAIPVHSSRALIFDAASGTPGTSPLALFGMLGRDSIDFGFRACVELTVHETGKLNGEYTLLMDLDSTTIRALGEFLVDLANRAAKEN